MSVCFSFSRRATQVASVPSDSVSLLSHWEVAIDVAKSGPWNCSDVDLNMVNSEGNLLFAVEPGKNVTFFTASESTWNSLLGVVATFYTGFRLEEVRAEMEEYAGRLRFYGLMCAGYDQGFYSPGAVRLLANEFRMIAETRVPNIRKKMSREEEFLACLNYHRKIDEAKLWINLKKHVLETSRCGGLMTLS